MSFPIIIKSLSGISRTITLDAGTSTYFVGANGSGKTRLAAKVETELAFDAHRISAHRAMTLNPGVAKIGEAEARRAHRVGKNISKELDTPAYRPNFRWGQRSETHLLNDFDSLVQILFAEQNNTAMRTHDASHRGTLTKPEFTYFQKICEIWERILPHRKLLLTGDDIKVEAVSESTYSAADMSDGERSVFYLLGQVLVATPGTVLIFDEPELHIHRAILAKLWDEVEAARPDCAFLVITHDLEFAATRPGQKFVIRDYHHPDNWTLEEVPTETGFSEETTTLILGSRRPILFVEGAQTSLDLALYRACYPDWTVIDRGSCTAVIHAVTTMRANQNLNRVTCAGIVDADSRSATEVARLKDLGVYVLPVAEIENLFLLPEVSKAILEIESHIPEEVSSKLAKLIDKVIMEVMKPANVDRVAKDSCKRWVDESLKSIDLSAATNPTEMQKLLTDAMGTFNIVFHDHEIRDQINKAVVSRDITELMRIVDLKHCLLTIAASELKANKLEYFKQWLCRTVPSNRNQNKLREALTELLPKITAQKGLAIKPIIISATAI